MKTNINILGQEYEIIKEKDNKRMKNLDAGGLCETYTKQIFIDDFEITESTLLNSEEYKKKVLRHEIIHAFLHESGLDINSEWARNEEMVDFFAMQFKKILKAFEETEVI